MFGLVRPLTVALFGASSVLAAGVGAALSALAREPGRSVVVRPPPAAAPVVATLTPPIAVVVPAPALAVPPAAPEPPPARPRALTPRIVAHCATAGDPPDHPELEPLCTWDAGFPAISGDGTMIALIAWGGDDEGEISGLSIQVMDARSTRIVRQFVIGEADAYERIASDKTLSDFERHTRRLRYRAAVKRRADRAQRWLDRAGFRSLVLLGSKVGDVPSRPGGEAFQAEILRTWVSVIDTRDSTVVLQADFGVPAPNSGDDDEDEDCMGWEPVEPELWWDARARAAVGIWFYQTGGCMCPSNRVVVVRKAS